VHRDRKGSNPIVNLLLISAGAIEGHFEGKTPREGHQSGVVLERKCSGSPGTCNPEENGLQNGLEKLEHRAK
jgi:hypothetical protein